MYKYTSFTLNSSSSLLPSFNFSHSLPLSLYINQHQPSSMNPKGTIVFSTVGRPQYGFDVFSLNIPNDFNFKNSLEQCLTDGISINFNAQFTSQNDKSLVFISERTGSPQIFLTSPNKPPQQLPSPTDSLFHDRPIIQNGQLYFISAHEQPHQLPLTSWSALYSTNLNSGDITRLTPYGVVDYSPSISPSGKLIAVASNGSRAWNGEFHELQTDIVVFEVSEPSKRKIICQHGGWPTWGMDDSSIYFHHQAEDGWWSIFKIELNSENFENPIRITPPGVHAFTPAAMRDGRGIVVATRRRDTKFRHIEIFDLVSQEFIPVTELINPNFHHYNPFASNDSTSLGYHRFRGEDSAKGESVIPHLEFIMSPEKEINMFRLNGYFPSSSPGGDFIAFNPEFTGLMIVKSDGSKKWTLCEGRTTFYNSWSPTEKNVIFTSIGPIFEKARTSVQIARVSFDLASLDDDSHERDIPVDIKILTKDDSGNNAFPACSPDGKYVLFRSGRSGHKNLYILDAVNGEFEGGEIRQLTDGSCIDTMPHWSPDGKLIAFSSNRHNPENAAAFSIYLVHPDGTGLRRIHVAGPEGSAEVDRERINHVCFSPDGEWLLFTANLDGVTAEPVSLPNQFQPYGDLYVARLDGSGLRRMTWNGYENGTPTWHPGNVLDLGRLGLSRGVGDKLEGRFEEPLWISCDL